MKTAHKELTIIIKPHDSEFEALCLQLDIAACAKTEKEAIEILVDLVELYLDDCYKNRQSPWRPVPTKALEEFLTPPKKIASQPFSSRQIPINHAFA